MIDMEGLLNSLETREFGKVILLFQKVESTQTLALEMMKDPESKHGTIIISHEQNSGVGRDGSRWISPQGGLWMSIIIRPNFKIENGLLLQFVAALAVQETIWSLTGLDCTIKWPNDVMIRGKKVCGIITDGSYESATLTYAVIGIGVNINFNDRLINCLIKPRSYRNATTLLSELGYEVNLKQFAKVMIEKFENYYFMLGHSSKEILKNWKRHTDIFGKDVIVIEGDKKFVGKAIDIEMDGGLLLDTSRGLMKIVSGRVYLP
jgi:BirA family biotin operon repressor/biotin-[acetyl-CoA-carboxylase] ligase